MKQKITLFFTWICAVVTAFVLRAVLREQRNMIMAGMYQHPHYETLKKHRETLLITWIGGAIPTVMEN